MESDTRTGAPPKLRKRIKGKWSGNEAKYSFLKKYLCDNSLRLRLEELRCASHWWPWLDSLQDEREDAITYFCPTYVLYDALAPEGRGDLESMYQRPTALKVFSEMLRSHLDAPWLSKYMTLPGGGRESRKVMLLQIDVPKTETLSDGIISRLRSYTVHHSPVPVLLAKGLRTAETPAPPPQNTYGAAKRRRACPTQSMTTSDEDNDMGFKNSCAADLPDFLVSASAPSQDSTEEDAAVALLGLCVQNADNCTNHQDSSYRGVTQGTTTAEHGHAALLSGLLDGEDISPRHWGTQKGKHLDANLQSFTSDSSHPQIRVDEGLACIAMPQSLTASSKDMMGTLSAHGLFQLPRVDFDDPCTPSTSSTSPMSQIQQWYSQQISQRNLHDRLANAAALMYEQLLAQSKLQQHSLSSTCSGSSSATRQEPEGTSLCSNITSDLHLQHLLELVSGWELSCSFGPFCQIYVPLGCDKVEVPLIMTRSPAQHHEYEFKLNQGNNISHVQWQACGMPGCRYLVSVGPYCEDHLQEMCHLAVKPTRTSQNVMQQDYDALTGSTNVLIASGCSGVCLNKCSSHKKAIFSAGSPIMATPHAGAGLHILQVTYVKERGDCKPNALERDGLIWAIHDIYCGDRILIKNPSSLFTGHCHLKSLHRQEAEAEPGAHICSMSETQVASYCPRSKSVLRGAAGKNEAHANQDDDLCMTSPSCDWKLDLTKLSKIDVMALGL